ncbi:MAG: OmpA family protein [Sandaracinaceae bacterium]
MGAPPRSAVLALGLLLWLAPSVAAAQELPWQVRFNGGLGAFLSPDQHSILQLDRVAAEAQARGGYAVHDNVVLEAGLAVGAFLSSARGAGGLLDLTLGVSAQGGDRRGILGWASLHGGVGLTGLKLRPALHVAAGVDVALSERVAVGPVLGYGQVLEDPGPRHTSDAIWMTFGLSVRWYPPQRRRVPERPPPRPPPERPPPEARDEPPLPSRPTRPPPEEEVLRLLDGAIGLVGTELLVPVLFAYDSTELLSCSIAALHALREHLEEHPEIVRLEVEGHADSTGSVAYNDELALRRAQTIVAWLVERGIDPERLVAVGQGERAPLESNVEEGGRAQNRRARFRVLEVGEP